MATIQDTCHLHVHRSIVLMIGLDIVLMIGLSIVPTTALIMVS
jgi:hypothetical protein